MNERSLFLLPNGSAEEATRFAAAAPDGAGFAVGVDLLTAVGPGVVGAVARVGPVAVLWALHGEPREVAEAGRRLAGFGASWILVHATAGRDAMIAAREAVTVEVVAHLADPHLGDDDAVSLGLGRSRGKLVSRLAAAAEDASMSAVTCGLPDLGVVAGVASDLKRIAVGLRTAADVDEAVARGADLVIVPNRLVDGGQQGGAY